MIGHRQYFLSFSELLLAGETEVAMHASRCAAGRVRVSRTSSLPVAPRRAPNTACTIPQNSEQDLHPCCARSTFCS